MSERVLAWLIVLILGAVLAFLVLGLPPVAAPAADNPPAGPDVFGATKVWPVHLEIPAKEYEAMQPPAGGGFGFPGGPGAPAAPPPPKREARPSERNLFGTEFPWAQGDATVGGTAFPKVGVRYAGDVTYFSSAQGLKRPLKVEFTRFGGQPWNGLTAVHFHAMPMDPAKAREALAYAVFRAAGVPAPRTAFAEVTLTVLGKFDKAYLGLYTLVENVDGPFLADRFQTDKGLLMKPFRLRGLDYLGDDWARYKSQYNPQSEATPEQAKRVVAFAKLINQSGDDEFRKQIDSFLDVDAFLRFLAANALTSNLESFLALGHNYSLYLHPQTNKFVFIPGDLEYSLANFLLMGSPDQLMDLSITHPYPGDNKLPDRLLAIPEVNAKYKQLLKDLSATVFTRERLVADAETIANATKVIREKEAKAVAARKEPPPGFGPPGGPQPPDVATFAAKRTASVAAQLAGTGKGYVPQFAFGPPPGGGGNNLQPVDEKTFRDLVQAPPGFDVTLFAAPPRLAYPVAIAAAPNGDVFVAIDEQGSLGRTPGGGRVLRCRDTDGDGKADEIKVFARMEHPRGVICQGNSVWVMHPPTLSVFHDDNGDGVADRQEVLVTGLTTDLITNRGGDHTTNGIRMGIDGWIYINVGDYGIKEAKGKDGTTIVQRGGGILRVRPDGTELEVYATGTRNIFDMAIDPFLNVFARDNTNDGAGWDIRVSHFVQTAHYGYTQLYANFPDEIMPTMGVYGGGGGTGALYVQDPLWPKGYADSLFTGDWGRSEVYHHELKPHGASFDLMQEVFLKIPRPTGMDIDASGHLYVASWRGGEASVYIGPNVGFVARVTPKGRKPSAAPDLKAADFSQLIRHLTDANSVIRLHAQRELLRRGRSAETTAALAALATDNSARLEGRVAAIFALKQLDGRESHPALRKLAADPTVREFALRALTDRKKEIESTDAVLLVAALADESPRVRAQAIIGLSRLGDASTAKNILPLTVRPSGSAMPTKAPVHAQPDPDRAIPHLAMRALVALKAIDACLDGLDGPYWEGALRAMRSMHDPRAVEGLIRKLGTVRDPELRRGILATLIRLYHREADYTGTWWGIRPDNTGPYFDRQEWEMSRRIGAVVTAAVQDGDPDAVAFLTGELDRHQVTLPGVTGGRDTAVKAEPESPIVLPKADPADPNQIGNMLYEAAAARTLRARGDAAKGKPLFKAQACVACHTDADGQTPRGPHLVDIGKRYKPDELVESILKPSAKLAQGFETYRFEMRDGRTFTGFVVSERAASVRIREQTGVQRELKLADIEARQRVAQSAMPDGAVNNLTPEQLADLIAYLQSLKGAP